MNEWCCIVWKYIMRFERTGRVCAGGIQVPIYFGLGQVEWYKFIDGMEGFWILRAYVVGRDVRKITHCTRPQYRLPGSERV